MAPSPRQAGILATVGAAFLWGTSFPANQVGLDAMEPGFFAAARFALAALVTLPFAWRLVRPTLTHWAPWALGAVNGLAFLLQYVGQVTAPAGAAGLLINANVVVVALVAWAFLGERPRARTWSAMALALVGASLIIYEPGGAGIQRGHLTVFAAGALWSFYFVGTRAALLRGHSPASLALATFVTTALALSPFLVLDPWPTEPVPLAMVAWTGLACTVLAFALWLRGLQHVGATASAVVLMIEIFVASILGAWLLDEAFPLRKLAGGAAILAAIVLLSGAERENARDRGGPGGAVRATGR